MIFLFDLLRDCMKCQILLLDQTQVSSVTMTHVSNIESLESISREANSNYNNSEEKRVALLRAPTRADPWKRTVKFERFDRSL